MEILGSLLLLIFMIWILWPYSGYGILYLLLLALIAWGVWYLLKRRFKKCIHYSWIFTIVSFLSIPMPVLIYEGYSKWEYHQRMVRWEAGAEERRIKAERDKARNDSLNQVYHAKEEAREKKEAEERAAREEYINSLIEKSSKNSDRSHHHGSDSYSQGYDDGYADGMERDHYARKRSDGDRYMDGYSQGYYDAVQEDRDDVWNDNDEEDEEEGW